MDFISDTFTALYLVLKEKRQQALQAWVYTPIGIILILGIVYGIQTLIGISSVQFPASVACMLLLFLALLAWEAIFGVWKAKQAYAIVEIPAGFGLRYLNIFFTPSFILLPLSKAVKGVEVAKTIGVFLIGFFFTLSATALLTRRLHLLLGTPKRYPHAREEHQRGETPRRFDRRLETERQLPLTNVNAHRTDHANNDEPPHTASSQHGDDNESSSDEEMAAMSDSDENASTPDESSGVLRPLRPAAEIARVRGPGPELDLTLSLQPTTDSITRHRMAIQQQPPVKTRSRAERWAREASPYLDIVTYAAAFCIGAAIYLANGPAFLMHLSMVVTAYLCAIRFPPHVRKFLHPVLSTSAISILAICIMSLVKCGIHSLPIKSALETALREFKTGEKYLQLLAPNDTPRKWPGAGDFFSSLLDVGIVGLALPMWTYRRELKQHYLSIFIPNILFSVGSLFAYPALCSGIGIAVPRALAFSARSVTLALGTPAVSNLQGDLQFVAVIVIMTGIMGVLVGGWVLDLIRIPLDDYLSRGVSLGSVSSAVTTAHLLTIDPRAAALSSLSMVVFGVSMVALTAIPPVVKLVWMIAGKQ